MGRHNILPLTRNTLSRLNPLMRRAKLQRQRGKGNEAIGKVVNIGTGRDLSIGELAKKIVELIGKGGKVEIEDRRFRPEKSEVMQLLADTRLAQKLFGWAPRYSLEDGLKETIGWD